MTLSSDEDINSKWKTPVGGMKLLVIHLMSWDLKMVFVDVNICYRHGRGIEMKRYAHHEIKKSTFDYDIKDYFVFGRINRPNIGIIIHFL